jgi:protein-tyrosine kinase
MTQPFRETGRLEVKSLKADPSAPLRSSISRRSDNPINVTPPRPEFARLLHAVSALNVDDRPFVLQFMSSTSGEGTSTIATNFVRAASFGPSRSALLVDCSPNNVKGFASAGKHVPTLIEVLQSGRPLDTAIHRTPGNNGIMVARLADSANPLLLIDAVTLQHLVDVLKQTYSVIALDCPAADQFSDSLAMSRHCDGTVLIVKAETTPRSLVIGTKTEIERFGGQLIGVVLNRSHLSVPKWLKWAG